MRLKIRHDTVYSYAEPARSALHILRLTPRNCACLFVKRWRIEIDGDARLDRGEDAHGNITHTVFVDGPLDGVRITVDGEVDTADSSGIMRGTVERLPLALYLRETALTAPSSDIQAFAKRCSADEAGDRLAALHRMMARLSSSMKLSTAAPDHTRTAAQAFEAQSGTAHDVAHIMIAAARSLSIPARFISGYYFDETDQQNFAHHGWLEAWVERIGWVGFDPAIAMCITDRHIRIAAGLDDLDAAPIRGTSIGGGLEDRKVAVQIQQGRQVMEA